MCALFYDITHTIYTNYNLEIEHEGDLLRAAQQREPRFYAESDREQEAEVSRGALYPGGSQRKLLRGAVLCPQIWARADQKWLPVRLTNDLSVKPPEITHTRKSLPSVALNLTNPTHTLFSLSNFVKASSTLVTFVVGHSFLHLKPSSEVIFLLFKIAGSLFCRMPPHSGSS